MGKKNRRAGWLTAGLLAGLSAGAVSAAGIDSQGPRLAYLDPGAGSFILQALVATIAGAIVAVNAYWTRIKRILGLAEKGEGEAASANESDDHGST